MNLRGKNWLAFAATAAALAACGPGSSPTDSGAEGSVNDVVTTPDGGNEAGHNEAGMNEAGNNEAGNNEAGNNEAGSTDGSTAGGVCTAGRVIDLATAGQVTGGVTHYTGTTVGASDTPELDAPCGTAPTDYVNQVAHKYHTMTASYLTVSTDNPGTDATTDTIVWVLDACSMSGTSSACNDDINFPDNPHSLATTTLIPAGTDVFIIVGLYGTTMTPATPGPYELTVREVAPIPAGGTCDPTGAELCAAGNSCVAAPSTGDAGATTGTCTANGTLGAACNPDTSAMRCNTGLVCRTDSNGRDTCFTAIPGGSACDPSTGPDRCADTFSCVGTGTTGTCNANGTSGAQCRPATASQRCDTGLDCRASASGTEICVTPVAAGASCTVGLDPDPCATGTVCAGDFQVGTCVAPGSVPNAPCITDASGNGTCNTGLECVAVSFFSQVCLRSRTLGQTCNYFEDTCGMTGVCEPSSQDDARNGSCIAIGAAGGYCDAMNACTTGNTCIMAAGAQSGICQASTPIAAGSACDPSGRTNACATGNTCAPGTTAGTFTCQANGSAAGTACATGGTCTALLTSCSATTGGFCETTAVTTCTPRNNTSACATGNACIATSITTGTCGATTAEGTAANDTPTTGESITLGTGGNIAISGALTPAGDEDCYTFTATAGQKLYAEVNNGKAGCNADEATIILLYDSQGRLIDGNFATGQNDPCPVLDGVSASASASPSANLMAGAYTICVQNTDSAATTSNYVLDVHLQ